LFAAFSLPAAAADAQASDRLADLHATTPARRCAALRAIGEAPPSDGAAEAVALMLTDASPEVRLAAVDTLAILCADLKESRDKLAAITAPRAEQRILRLAAGVRVRQVFLFDPSAVAAAAELVTKLQAEDAPTRRDAVIRLCRLGASASDHQDAVLAMLGDAVAEVRAAVAGGAGKLGWNAALVAAMARAIRDPAPSVRQGAAATLAGHDDCDAVAVLRTAVQDPEPQVRAAVLGALGDAGAAAAPATGEIEASIRDRDLTVRIAALSAVKTLRLADARAVAECTRCLGDDEAAVVITALQGLAIQGLAIQSGAARDAFARVAGLTQHADAVVRAAALATAMAIADGPRRGSAILLCARALSDGSSVVRGSAEDELQRSIHGDGAGPPLLELR
jgi:HEAT repeat protein